MLRLLLISIGALAESVNELGTLRGLVTLEKTTYSTKPSGTKYGTKTSGTKTSGTKKSEKKKSETKEKVKKKVKKKHNNKKRNKSSSIPSLCKTLGETSCYSETSLIAMPSDMCCSGLICTTLSRMCILPNR